MKTLFVLIGLLMLSGGCWLHYPPLAPIVAGGFFLACGVGLFLFGARNRGERTR